MLKRLLISAVMLAAIGIATIETTSGGPRSAVADTSLDSEEMAFITLINNYRAQNSLGPLLIDPSITAAADWMSADMGEKAYFSHTDSLGRSPWTRMCDFGYCYNTWKGENIAAGYVTAAAVFQGWKDSPGHNANMLGPNYTVMGLARVNTPGSPFGWYWTNDFGGYTVNPTPPPAPTNTPTPTPTAPPATPTPTPTQAPTSTPSPTNTPAPTASPTPTPTATPTTAPTHTPTPTATPNVTSTPRTTVTAPPTPTAGPTQDPSPTATAMPASPADVDCDATVTGNDSLRILRFVANVGDSVPGCPPVGAQASHGTPQGLPAQLSYHGDVDCDGVVDLGDALRILRFVAGTNSAGPFSCG